jgi:hypothetical protein
VESDGLYGDLHFLKSHPMAEQVCEIAWRNQSQMGFSHNAVVRESRDRSRGGEVVFEAIERVRSVDVVCSPATTSGIFESVDTSRATEFGRACDHLVYGDVLPPSR